MKNETLEKKPEKTVKDEFVYLELDRRRELKYSMKALKLLEQQYEKPMIKLFDYVVEIIVNKDIKVDDVYKLIHAGLIREDPELTLEKTEDILEQSDYHLGNLDELLLMIFSSMASSTPEMKDKIEKKAQSVTLRTVGQKKKKKAGTGRNSSRQRSGSSDGQKITSGDRLQESTTEQSKEAS